MFENIRLITKRDNKISEPDLTWDKNSKIHCSCELNIGFGEKFIWNDSNSILLTTLIDFYTILAESITNPNNDNYQYSFKNNESTILFLWTRTEPTAITFNVRYKQHNIDKEVLCKKVWSSTVWEYKQDLYLKVMTTLTKLTTSEVCINVGENFFNNTDSEIFEFHIGQHVRTILGENVKTQRSGFIINRSKHHKNNMNMYQLLIDGKVLDKRYLPNELEIE